jgi:hypothetical protein
MIREYEFFLQSYRKPANPRMQPTAFGTQDRWFFEAILCSAPRRRLMRKPLGRHLNADTALHCSKIAYTGTQRYAHSALKERGTYGDSQNNDQSLPAWI